VGEIGADFCDVIECSQVNVLNRKWMACEGSVAMPYIFGDYTLDRQRYELRQAGQRIPLEPKAFDPLLYLVEHRDRVVGRDELLDQVWPEQFISDHSLTARLRAVRQVLGDDARTPRFTATVHGRGYRFIGSVYTTSEPDTVREISPQPVMPQRSALAEVSSATESAVPMVGRESEIAFLHHCLDQVQIGKRQVVFVTGEAGVGKTTLVEAFVQEVGHAEAMWIGCGQCIEHYGSGEAYLPVLEAMEQVCRSPGGQTFVETLCRQAPTWMVQMPWLLSPTDLERLRHMTLGATRERMLREMARALEVLTTEKPLLLVLEDLHWSDSSTLDLLAMLARRQEPAKLFVLGTYRPEEVMGQGHPLYTMTHELRIHGHCETWLLPLLSEAAVAAYLRARFPEAPDLEALIRFIHRRTEGNPLFMVNVVDEVVAQDGVGESGVPENLRQLLEQRLSCLSPDEQRLLEVGSIVGAEFTAAAVASALEIDIEAVEVCCEGLTRRGQWLQARGTELWPDGTGSGCYGFIHSLYQRVAYGRVAPGRLLHLHRRIGERLESGYGTQAEELAAELAMHFEHGQAYPQAIEYREQAAQNAIERSAYQEAAMHLNKGLALLETRPPTPERAQQELRLLMILAPVLRNTKGQAAPEVGDAYTRAYTLCQQMADAPQHFLILRGLWNYYNNRAELRIAHELAEQFFSLAQRQDDVGILLWGHCLQGMGNQYYRGAFASARDHFAQALVLYDRFQHRSLMFQYGQDPGVLALAQFSWMSWMLGYPEQALGKSHDALALAKELTHPYSLAAVLTWVALLHQFRRERQAVRQLAEAIMAIASENGFAQRLAWGESLRGWALAAPGQAAKSLEQIQRGLAALHATGQELWRPYNLALLAEAYREDGYAEDGLRALDEALAFVEATGDCLWEAELHRLKGDLLLRQTPSDDHQSVTCFHRALDTARHQQAKSLELRAATSLAHLWQSQGKCQEARELLEPVYGWFTEGFDTADLRDAKALLDKLRAKMDPPTV
jgi:DNA-binding winged helix-turn-helix (wHTH) protein/predicted ATPase